MLGVTVSPQVYLPLKPFITETTGKWLVASMLSHVRD